ncbi:MAG: hypothetical protein N0A16_12900 [Blastocatellia bacterium]|nr:hypothetical protein [Blastocatellia bacterium]MCX7753549.1 hypothetical protein [Blastocatellia bacterium]MDW8168179.1 hypothetical protein [Acidobacteriota bacterium]MDW8255404.1 hypothetical protein [Acidobacteriota bacterium]
MGVRHLLSGLVGGLLILNGLTIRAQEPTSPEETQEAAVTRRYSNVKWSAERNTLLGANIILTRQGDRVTGTYVLFDGSEQGTSHRLTGTARDGRISFTVRAQGMTLHFTGRMTDQELVGRMTITRPDGTREEREFKARRLWR